MIGHIFQADSTIILDMHIKSASHTAIRTNCGFKLFITHGKLHYPSPAKEPGRKEKALNLSVKAIFDGPAAPRETLYNNGYADFSAAYPSATCEAAFVRTVPEKASSSE